MGFITKKIHAYLDYPVAVALIVLPFVLGLGNSNPLALQLSVGTGIAAFILTLLTDHQLGVFRIIPYKGHLAVDALVGIVFVIAPFVFSFQGVDAYYYWIIGGSVLFVVSLHKAETTASL
ncbi:hypothetical protein SNE25_20405 [Mucilaginibacter sabulilitoris]|uniref:SPW repeat-containing integral membrane domain-containing protein n=1 Tax=Mucilaginibacter sabulilitoris TaxID=1173583 RepID=A0ABZ0TIZ2_9SPHI|nr:hypothetical protein [Mucilaginibacter sabulilitoris]WPU91684.1 hypothetical protein SNE25_20405 [Mucilaginibacter sabulilitoris]